MIKQTTHVTSSDFRIEAPLPLLENEVHLWRVDLEEIRADEVRWLELLSPEESARAARFHFAEDRQRFAASRAWLRKILAGYLTTDRVVVEAGEIAFSYSAKGKPLLSAENADSGIVFNLSHSGEISLYAFALRRAVGVDVERMRRNSDVEAIAKRFFSPREQKELLNFSPEERVDAFFRCWSRKEAYIKATGEGLSLPLDQFDVSLQADCPDALLATRPHPQEAARWRIQEVLAGPGYAAAVCGQGRDWILNAGW